GEGNGLAIVRGESGGGHAGGIAHKRAGEGLGDLLGIDFVRCAAMVLAGRLLRNTERELRLVVYENHRKADAGEDTPAEVAGTDDGESAVNRFEQLELDEEHADAERADVVHALEVE